MIYEKKDALRQQMDDLVKIEKSKTAIGSSKAKQQILPQNFFDTKAVRDKREQVLDKRFFKNEMISHHQKFGDEIEKMDPDKWVILNANNKWKESRAKLTVEQKNQLAVDRNNRAIGVEKQVNKEVKTKKELKKEQIQLGKDVFQTWDEDGGGSLSKDEIFRAFIKMGLSQDHHFAEKVLSTMKTDGNFDEDIELKDFIRIFKDDELSDFAINAINQEIKFRAKRVKDQKKMKNNKQAHFSTNYS